MNVVQIDYYKKSKEGYLSNEKLDHFILDIDGKLNNGFYITFDNTIVKDKQCKIFTLSTKAKLASDFDTKMIKKFIDKLSLSDYNIPYGHALLRNYKGEFLKALLTIEDHGYVTDGESIYKVDESYDLVSNSYYIIFFEEEVDEEIANYVYDNRDKILKPSNFDSNYNIRKYNIGEIPSGFTASCAFTSEYFSVFVVENHFNVEFDSYSGSSNNISTNGKNKNYVSWAENLAFIILAKKNVNAFLIDERFNYDLVNMVYYTKASNYYIAYLRIPEPEGRGRTLFSVNKELNIAIAEIALRFKNIVIENFQSLFDEMFK